MEKGSGLTKKEKADLKEDNEAIALGIKIEILRKKLAAEMRAEAEQKRIDAEADKRDKAGGIKKGMNKGGITKKAKTGSMDYRKGGMTYSTSSKK